MQFSDASLRAVLDSVFAAPAYSWTEQPHPFTVAREWWQRLADWLANARTLHPVLFESLVIALTVVLVAILVHAGYILQQTLRAATRRESEALAPTPTVRRDAAWYLRAADDAAAAGRYRDALELVFGALVLRLDAMGLVRWGPGKTARDYTREARLDPPDRARLSSVVGVLHRYLYSGAACGPPEYTLLREAAVGDWHAAAG